MLYSLVSGSFEMLDSPHKGEVLGQEFELSAAQVQSAITDGRACLLPKEEFARLFADVDPKLIAKYSNARLQSKAPPEFRAVLSAAIDAATKHRQELIIAATAPKPDKPAVKAAKEGK
jgi:hypothetical protein